MAQMSNARKPDRAGDTLIADICLKKAKAIAKA